MDRPMNPDASSRPGRLRVLLDLTKFRITIAVTLTTTMGYLLARRGVRADLWMPLVGTFLLAAGSSALNQCQEAAIDARMSRTRGRPIPRGLIDRTTALFIAGLLILLGLFVLTSADRHVEATLLLAVFAVLWYNGLYTYLKRVTAFAVVPGALIGAIPPVIGYTCAGGDPLDPVILLVAAFVFIWQIPHFWLLLLLVGDQYAEAGLPTLTQVFSRQQLFRVTFMWMLSTAVAGTVFPSLLRHDLFLPWSIVIVLASFWLAAKAVGLVWSARAAEDGRPFKRAFVHINLYALIVVVSLSLNAVGLAWR
jgi:heme o synthase